MKKSSSFVRMLLEIVLVVFLSKAFSVVLEGIGKVHFGIEVQNSDLLLTLLAWSVAYAGITLMLLNNSHWEDDNLPALTAVVILDFIRNSDILFIGIVPAVEWGKTGDLLLFLGGLALLTGPVLLIVFYKAIHKFFFAEDEETEKEEKKEF